MSFSFVAKPFGENLIVEFNHNGEKHSFVMPLAERGNLILELERVIKELEEL